MFGLALQTAAADVIDDIGVPEQQFLRTVRSASTPMMGRGPQKQIFLGLPLSDARVAAIVAELGRFPDGRLEGFVESRGDFARALESKHLAPLDRMRLLVRAGRADEALAVLQPEVVRTLSQSLNPSYQLLPACRPLEDAEAWEQLRVFLRLLGERLDSPQWRVALWAEELDVAWHLDQVPALLAEAAKDPLRLAVFHQRLGNEQERDAIVAGLLENATPVRITDLVGLLPDCPPVTRAAVHWWNREDLASEDRAALFSMLTVPQQGKDFEELFRGWLVKGGDALPLADAIWQRWAPAQTDNPQRMAVLSALSQRHPDEPKFRFLVGRQLMKTDPARATELFETLAALPLTAAPNPNPRTWQSSGLGSIQEEARNDLPYLAICGLGILNRQDLIGAALDRQAGWPSLPPIDQARYLAAGKMDHALVKLVLEADYSKPENDSLAGALQLVLEHRLTERTLPPELSGQLAARFDTMTAGSSGKKTNAVFSDALGWLEILGKTDGAALKEPFGRLLATTGQRNASQVEGLKKYLGSVLSRHPGLKDLLPGETLPAAGESTNISQGMAAQELLGLFAPPQIRRIKQNDAFGRTFPRESFGGPAAKLPLILLGRWVDNPDSPMGPRAIPGQRGPLNKGSQTAVQTLMRFLGPGNPRRLLAEILIAKGVIDCGDEALKAEAQAGFSAFMAGGTEARGSEAFLYTVLAAEEKVEMDELLEVLARLKSQPPSARASVLRQLAGSRMENRVAAELVRKELGPAGPQSVRPTPKADEDARKLEELIGKNLSAAPETVEVAKRMLDKAAMVASDDTNPPNAYSAVRVLETTGSLDAWLKESREKLRAAGIPQVEILLRLQQIDRRQGGDAQSRTAAYSREILALDPTSAKAAQSLIRTAAQEGNRELLLACLRAMGTQGLYQLSQGEVLGAFGQEDAAKVFAFVREQNLNGSLPGNEIVGRLHQYFLNADPTLAAEFRGWLGARGATPAEGRILIAAQLLDAGLRDEAVDLIARAFVTPPVYPGFPHQLPPRPGADSVRNPGYFDVEKLKLDVEFLRERKLLDPVIARIDALGAGDPLVTTTFRMAAMPDAATFERHAAPILEKLGESSRGATTANWIDLFSKQPRSSELVLRLYQARSEEKKDSSHIYQNVRYLQEAAVFPGSAPLITKIWRKLATSITGLDAAKKSDATRHMVSLLREMLVSADDATWCDFWAWREKEETPLGDINLMVYGRTPTGFIDPARLRQVLPRLLKESPVPLPGEMAAGFALMAIAAGDRAMLEQVKAVMPPNHGAVEICDLGLGNTAAASPVFDAAKDDNGETLLSWNFVSIASDNKESKVADIPRCPFPALDGKFELQFTAGRDSNRQVIVSKLSAAPAAGHIRLKLAPDQRYVAVLATDPANGVVRWSRTLDTHSSSGRPLPLSDKDLLDRRFEKLAWNGPDGMPAWKVRFSGRESIDLLERPWTGTEPVSLGVWVSGSGEFKLRCLDTTGKELQALDLASWDSFIPVWQYRSLRVPEKLQFPTETVKLVISASVYGFNDGPLDFAFSNARMEIGPPAALPEKFERITRVPGTASSLALSPDASRLAIGLRSGRLVIVDLSSRETVEIPTNMDPENINRRPVQMVWNSAGLHVRQTDGILYRLDEAGRSLGKIASPIHGGEQTEISAFEMSDDGKWILWKDQRFNLILASADGTVRRELAPRTSDAFGFTGEGVRFSRNGHPLMLKTVDFTTGEPVEETPSENQPALEMRKNRFLFHHEGDGSEPDNNAIRIPVARSSAAFNAEGPLYYMDEAGNVIRVIP